MTNLIPAPEIVVQTTDYKKKAYDLFDELSKTNPLFHAMEKTVEGSPWHREANVLVHTKMVLNEYARRTDVSRPYVNGKPSMWDRDDYLGAVECIFHDTGKPPAEIEKWSEKRGKYRAYHGHEQISARLFEDWASAQTDEFTAKEIARIVFMIEQHMPWSIENDKKLDQLAMTAKAYGAKIYMRTLLADQFGRMSDDWDINTARSAAWVEKFATRVESCPEVGGDSMSIFVKWPKAEGRKHLVMPIAPSGAGKSTYLRQYGSLDFVVESFSLDALRHEWYDANDYAKAFELAMADKKFEGRADVRYLDILKAGNHDAVFVDNTNVGARRRTKYIAEATKRGYVTRAVLMPSTLKTLIDRQKTRGDKNVPAKAVHQQYMSLAGPLLGEFDQIHFSGHNLL